MKFSGLQGRPRPPLYDAEQAIESMALLRSYPKSWESSITEEETSQRYVKIRSGRLELWVYMGAHGDHLIVPAAPRERTSRSADVKPIYCSCEGFQRRLLSEDEFGCTHVIAFSKALRRGGKPHSLEGLPIDDMLKIVNEVLTLGQSVTLRRILYSNVQKSTS
ncbi:hypothetical protein [Acidilobus saccharovorans]|nr:hypothetical protein [Acidilobus saccharovorans]